jgi:hypothetical protein
MRKRHAPAPRVGPPHAGAMRGELERERDGNGLCMIKADPEPPAALATFEARIVRYGRGHGDEQFTRGFDGAKSLHAQGGSLDNDRHDESVPRST